MPRQSPADGVWRLEARRSDLIFSRLRRVKSGLLLRALQRQPSLSQANPPASRWEPLSLHHNPFSSSGDLSIVSKAPHSCLGGPGSLGGSILLTAHLPGRVRPL